MPKTSLTFIELVFVWCCWRRLRKDVRQSTSTMINEARSLRNF